MFPPDLKNGIHHRKNSTANATSQMTTSQMVTKISAAIEEMPTHTLNPTSKKQRNTQPNADQGTALNTTTKKPTTMPSTKNEVTTEQMTSVNPTPKQSTTMPSTKKEPTTEQMTSVVPSTKQPTTMLSIKDKSTKEKMTTGDPTDKQPTIMPSTKNELITEEMTKTDPTTIKLTTESMSTEYTDCYDLNSHGYTADGIYQIKPLNWTGSPFDVFCNMSDGEGWTVFQRRLDGSVDFYLDWMSYKHGFGDLNGEFWLGNEKLFFLTSQKNYEFQVDFVDENHVFYKLTYDMFSIGDENDEYRLKTLGNYMGYPGEVYDYMNEHINKKFTTKDQDNDDHTTKNCAVDKTGAWWYTRCGTANLNGDYDGTFTDSIYVRNKDTEEHLYNIRYTEMKVRPVT